MIIIYKTQNIKLSSYKRLIMKTYFKFYKFNIGP